MSSYIASRVTSEDRPDQLDFDRVSCELTCRGKTASGSGVTVAAHPVFELDEASEGQLERCARVIERSTEPEVKKAPQNSVFGQQAFGISRYVLVEKTEQGLGDRPQYKLVLHHMADRLEFLVTKERFDGVEVGQEVDVEVRVQGTNVFRR